MEKRTTQADARTYPIITAEGFTACYRVARIASEKVPDKMREGVRESTLTAALVVTAQTSRARLSIDHVRAIYDDTDLTIIYRTRIDGIEISEMMGFTFSIETDDNFIERSIDGDQEWVVPKDNVVAIMIDKG